MPFWTLRVLFATQSVANGIPTQSVRNDNLNYRATQSGPSSISYWAVTGK